MLFRNSILVHYNFVLIKTLQSLKPFLTLVTLKPLVRMHMCDMSVQTIWCFEGFFTMFTFKHSQIDMNPQVVILQALTWFECLITRTTLIVTDILVNKFIMLIQVVFCLKTFQALFTFEFPNVEMNTLNMFSNFCTVCKRFWAFLTLKLFDILMHKFHMNF